MTMGRCVSDTFKAIQMRQWVDVSVIRLRLYRRGYGPMCR